MKVDFNCQVRDDVGQHACCDATFTIHEEGPYPCPIIREGELPISSTLSDLPTKVPITNFPELTKMQGIGKAVRSCQERLQAAILQHSQRRETAKIERMASCFKWVTSPPAQQKGLENVTVADVLVTKGEETGPWLWCHTDDPVIDAIKNMAKNNIGSLVVLKPGEKEYIAGIITERDYLRKIIAQERSPIYTRVGEIMTDENKLITVTSNTNILQAMQLMTENQIRHVPVIDGKLVGMISIKDVVRAVVEQQSGELKRLNEYIRGEYY